LDDRTCDCCQTDAAALGDTILVAYRDRSADEVRDIYTVRRDADGWHAPTRVFEDHWVIPGCPVNGPAIAAQGQQAAIAWFSMGSGSPEVKIAFTEDQGVSYGAPILIERATGGAATLGRVDAEWVDPESVLVSWLTAVGDKGEIRYRTVDRDGALGPVNLLSVTAPTRSSGFPRMVRTSDGLLVAWTLPGEPSQIQLAELSIAVPTDH